MQNEESSYPEKYEEYEFELEKGNWNVYSFQTSTGAVYNVIFKSSPYVFGEDSIFAPYVYELIVKLKETKPVENKTDRRLPFTVYAIFKDFYKRNGDINICLYICDSSDGKQKVRARKFVTWFKMLNDGGIIYMGDDIRDIDGTIYPVAVLMKRTNPYRFQIIEAFDNLIISSYKNE